VRSKRHVQSDAYLNVYAKRITSAKRFLLREEVSELFIAIEASNYGDLNPGNFIVAQDGIYFIDNEFKSFNSPIEWGKMIRLERFIAIEDREWFSQLISEKLAKDQPPIQLDIGEVSYLCNSFRRKNKRGKECNQEENDFLLQNLETVKNIKKVGFFKEKIFSFPLEDIGFYGSELQPQLSTMSL
jgi:hypothetical protein